MQKMLIGIDIGGTKTSIRADNLPCQQQLTLRTAEWRRHDWDLDAQALLDIATQYARDHGGVPAAMGIGAHGCDDVQECNAFQDAFKRIAPLPVKVVNDAELMPATMNIEQGIGVVCGTGSIAVTRQSDGQLLTAGGWGWILGDEGSAPALVREAGRAAYLHVDMGGSADEPLVKGLCESLGISSCTRLGSAIASHRSAEELGRHAPIIFAAANQGSELATKVITDGAFALVDLVERLKKNGAEASEVVAGGGVISSQPVLSDLFLSECQDRFGASICARLIDREPVVGAVNIAKSLIPELRSRKESQ